MLQSRDLWSDSPPEPRTRNANYPTLLFSWWCTGFAVVIILVRVCGRKIRVGRIFSEDWIMLASLIPLLIRMGLVHVILLFGTNNIALDGITQHEIWSRSIGSRLVLASRIFYAMFIWVSKLTVSEFLKRLSRASWKKSHERGLHFIRIFLGVTFIAVVIATLTECQPFDHYWQVTPDPGPRCRQGFAQLITMGAADMITDILLVCWPIPIIIKSGMPVKRKLSLVFLFSLSLGLIGITGARVPLVIAYRGRQQYRTVWASAEILASAAVANAVVLGSFVRDRGVKRNRYRPTNGSTFDSMDRAATTMRRPTLVPHMTHSDEDLFRAIGCRVPQELCEPTSPIARPAPAALSANEYFMSGAASLSTTSLGGGGRPSLTTPSPSHHSSSSPHLKTSRYIPDLDLDLDSGSNTTPHDSADALPKLKTTSAPPSTAAISPLAITNSAPAPAPASATRTISFFDVGGLLGPAGEGANETGQGEERRGDRAPPPPTITTTTSDSTRTATSSLPTSATSSGTSTVDFATAAPPAPAVAVAAERRRSSSRHLFADLSERLAPGGGRRRSSQLSTAAQRERGSVSTAGEEEGLGGRRLGRRVSQTQQPQPQQQQQQQQQQRQRQASRSGLERDESGAISLQDVGGLLK